MQHTLPFQTGLIAWKKTILTTAGITITKTCLNGRVDLQQRARQPFDPRITVQILISQLHQTTAASTPLPGFAPLLRYSVQNECLLTVGRFLYTTDIVCIAEVVRLRCLADELLLI